ncbi:MAG TPA: hypothetical protein PKJ41_19440, partial [Bryobacteraceae bacterium]|nr:hypothetical protein [Bryobacteraceae bacterium]
ERVALELSRKIEKVPGVIAVVPSSGSMMNRVAQAQITILLAPPGERGTLNEIAAQIRGIMLPEYAYTRPGLRFPNVLGGRDTFSPIRATLLGPDL